MQKSTLPDQYQLSDAGAYLFSETDDDFTLTAAQPLRVNESVKVTVDRVGSGEGCMASDDSNASTTNVVLTLPSSALLMGASVNTKCKKQRVE